MVHIPVHVHVITKTVQNVPFEIESSGITHAFLTFPDGSRSVFRMALA